MFREKIESFLIPWALINSRWSKQLNFFFNQNMKGIEKNIGDCVLGDGVLLRIY